MTKAELVEKMAKDAGISKAAAAKALSSFTAGITKALKKKDGKITLVDFGTFHLLKSRFDQRQIVMIPQVMPIPNHQFFEIHEAGKQC